MNTYELFSGDELEIAERIQQRRYQLLIHSCIYYHLNTNLISDKTWDGWAKELQVLQTTYPNISEQVTLHEYFRDWDASTGAFLPITLEWVISLAKHVLKLGSNKSVIVEKSITQPKLKKLSKKRLF